MMPQGAAALRARQGAALAGVVYEKETDAALGELLTRLTAAGAASSLPPYEAATVRDAARSYRRRVALSKEMAQREARLSSEGYQAWVAARAASDFTQFAPVLTEWLALTREKCAAIDATRSAYDMSLDTFERGMTSARLDEIFAAVRDGLVPLLAAVRQRGTPPDDAWLSGAFDVEEQAALCREIAVAMGFDLERGRLDVSVHPFTGGAGPSDVRMTTRFKPTDLTEGLTGAIHETGHALYEQGRPSGEHEGLPVSEALSMGVHESQSLLWERMVALSRPFATFLLPRLRARFPQLPADKTADDLYAALNKVSIKSLIRVEADELNYPLHIILRYELESALLAGTISVEQLPALWNEKMAAYLGVTPESDAQGVLQDVHWSAGAIGYFPTYSLGAMMACQIFAAAQRELPTLDEDLAAVRARAFAHACASFFALLSAPHVCSHACAVCACAGALHGPEDVAERARARARLAAPDRGRAHGGRNGRAAEAASVSGLPDAQVHRHLQALTEAQHSAESMLRFRGLCVNVAQTAVSFARRVAPGPPACVHVPPLSCARRARGSHAPTHAGRRASAAARAVMHVRWLCARCARSLAAALRALARGGAAAIDARQAEGDASHKVPTENADSTLRHAGPEQKQSMNYNEQ
jgi:Zn-dependent M32 family carboxypeptidase